MTAGADRPERERAAALLHVLDRRGDEVLQVWTGLQHRGSATLGTATGMRELQREAVPLLDALREGVRGGEVDDPSGPAYRPLRELLAGVSARSARTGATPSETATGVLALREALVAVLRDEFPDSAADLAGLAITAGRLVDALALVTFETFVRSREEVINRQGQQLLELSTPVVRLWHGIVGVPLVGTLDSNRAQVVMEALLQAIVSEQATVAILDITGVPTVDTLVAQHLLKTVAATRLMGADCIICGIRPQTAQTIVQLGIDLSAITTRATLADALATGIARLSAAAASGPGR